MKVILTQDIRGKGKRGQMIEVSDGYARNFLLPRKLAVEASANAINTIQNAKAAEEHRQAHPATHSRCMNWWMGLTRKRASRCCS